MRYVLAVFVAIGVVFAWRMLGVPSVAVPLPYVLAFIGACLVIAKKGS